MSEITSVPISGRTIVQDRHVVATNGKCLGRGQLGNVNGTLYTAPSGTTPLGSTQQARLRKILLCNTDTTTAYKATIYLVESGGTAAANRAILSAQSISANNYLLVDFGDEGMTLESGETIQGLADTGSKVTYRLDGAEIA